MGREKGSLIPWSLSCLSSSSSNFSSVVVLALLILLELLSLNWFPNWSLPLSSPSSVLLSVRCVDIIVAISWVNCVMPSHYLYGNTQILSIIQSPSWLSTPSSLLLHQPIVDHRWPCAVAISLKSLLLPPFSLPSSFSFLPCLLSFKTQIRCPLFQIFFNHPFCLPLPPPLPQPHSDLVRWFSFWYPAYCIIALFFYSLGQEQCCLNSFPMDNPI